MCRSAALVAYDWSTLKVVRVARPAASPGRRLGASIRPDRALGMGRARRSGRRPLSTPLWSLGDSPGGRSPRSRSRARRGVFSRQARRSAGDMPCAAVPPLGVLWDGDTSAGWRHRAAFSSRLSAAEGLTVWEHPRLERRTLRTVVAVSPWVSVSPPTVRRTDYGAATGHQAVAAFGAMASGDGAATTEAGDVATYVVRARRRLGAQYP
jgi:hypothetical protein